jgi:hypothetical protein
MNQREIVLEGGLNSYKMAVFWVIVPCSLVVVYQRFRGPCCLHHQGDDDGGIKVNFYQTTRRCNLEDSHLRTHRRENLKSCLDSSGSGYGPVARSCEHGNGPSVSIKGEEFLDWLRISRRTLFHGVIYS